MLKLAVERGHTAVGIDVDPLAVLMSQVATSKVNVGRLVKHADSVIQTAKKSRRETPSWHDTETREFVNYWFGANQSRQLTRLAHAIVLVDGRPERRALRIALSRLIITKTPTASLAADTSHSRPHKVINHSDFDVIGGFRTSVKQVAARLAERTIKGSAEVRLGDSRALAQLPGDHFDLVVTSPPYLNAIDYLRGHKLSLIWFGYTIAQLRRIRSDSIGSERSINEVPSTAVSSITEEALKGRKPDPRRQAMIHRYTDDLLAFSHEIHRVCNRNAAVVLVVGNSTLRGNYVRNDLIATRAMQNAGFELLKATERDIPDNRRYMPTTGPVDTPIASRMRKEVVLTFSVRDDIVRSAS